MKQSEYIDEATLEEYGNDGYVWAGVLNQIITYPPPVGNLITEFSIFVKKVRESIVEVRKTKKKG